MSEHEAIRELLPLAASGDLLPEEMKRVREHLARCEACRRASEDFAELGGALRGLPTPQPRAELVAQVYREGESSLARMRARSESSIFLAPLVAASWIAALATWPLLSAAVRWVFTGWAVPGGSVGTALAAYSILGFILACVSALAVGKRARAIGRIQ